MAIIHRATLIPTKLELVLPWLDQQSWGGAGDPEVVGDGDVMVGVRDQTVRLTLEPGPAHDPDVRVAHVVGEIEAAHRLVASWDGGSGAVAAG